MARSTVTRDHKASHKWSFVVTGGVGGCHGSGASHQHSVRGSPTVGRLGVVIRVPQPFSTSYEVLDCAGGLYQPVQPPSTARFSRLDHVGCDPPHVGVNGALSDPTR